MQTQPQQTESSPSPYLADECRLQAIPPEHLADVFPLIKEMMEGVAERSNGVLTVPAMLHAVAHKKWFLWVVWDGSVRGIVAAELHIARSGMRVCSIHFCTGRGAKDWTHLLSEIEDWARANDCVRLDMLARKGWAKHLPDYRLSHIMLEKDLT